MEEIEELLLDKVKEKGIVKIILDYKEQMEQIKTSKPLEIIDELMLNYYTGNFRKISKRNVIKDSRLSTNNFRNRSAYKGRNYFR